MNIDNYHIEELKEHFNNHSGFSPDEIQMFYQRYLPDINLAAIKMRIGRLIKKGIINCVGHGKYEIGNKKTFIPFLDTKLKAIYKQIQNQFPLLNFVKRTMLRNCLL